MTLRIIAGLYKGRLLKTPKGPNTRPTQGMLREAVFNICQNDIAGARFLDLFAGSGAMGFEAVSRGAAHATLVESNRAAIACIKENIATLEAQDHIVLLSLDAPHALKKLSIPFDLIYIDPPYGAAIAPFIEQILAARLLAPHGILFVEERYNPKKTTPPSEYPSLHLKDSRRFGIALLHQYRIHVEL